jgi:protoporphyrinogen oxidase
MILVLGSGVAGLSASFHLGHDNCLVLEARDRPFGHVGSDCRDGFVWDQGPHVSFTKNEYVRDLFARSVSGRFREIDANVGNYYHGTWISHPAQTSLYQVPEPLRTACLQSILEARRDAEGAVAQNYQEWLESAFGSVFANTFPAVYTRKYWTVPASRLATEWIGNRVLRPDLRDVKLGAEGALGRATHYIQKVRYPDRGGYQSFIEVLRAGANVRCGAEVVAIDLRRRVVRLAGGEEIEYDQIVNTLPLPTFVGACTDVPSHVLDAVRSLTCTQLLLVNVAVPHAARRPEHWIYVYDSQKLTSRINFTEKLSPNNAPAGWTGIQAEVYYSRHRPLPAAADEVADMVVHELLEMGLLDPTSFLSGESIHVHTKSAPWANVVFELGTAAALEVIWRWLEGFGLARQADDVHPLTDWSNPPREAGIGPIAMAGRFAQWKYFWSDDCVLRGRALAEMRRVRP